jgi:hypothetical protein
MTVQNKLKIITTNLIIFLLLFGTITLNKELIRPAANGKPIIETLTGCFPNFIAAYLISLTATAGLLIKKPNNARLLFCIFCFLVFAGLSLEEIRPMWGASTHFDSFDIIASAAGSLLALLTFEIITSRQKQHS